MKNKNNKKPKNSIKYLVLGLSCLTLLVNFWAWSVLSPLASGYGKTFQLTPLVTSLLIGLPIIFGAFGRILVGLLADKFGGKRLIIVVCFLSVIAIIGLSKVATLPQLFLAATALGVAGTSFAAGSLFISSWFPKNERGLALGIYAFGNAGTALTGFITPKLVDKFGLTVFYMILAVILSVVGLLLTVFTKESPSWQPAKNNIVERFKQALSWKLTWRLALIYGLTFGGFVALSLYLPTLLTKDYGLSLNDAAARAAGFVLIATLLRPVGGWLSDKFSGLVVLRIVFFAVGALAVVAALPLSLMPTGTIVFLSIGAMFGLGNGALFAVIGHRCSQNLIGTVTGIVGAVGGIGGFIPTLILGASAQITDSYALAFALLSITSFVVAISMRRLFGYPKTY